VNSALAAEENAADGTESSPTVSAVTEKDLRLDTSGHGSGK